MNEPKKVFWVGPKKIMPEQIEELNKIFPEGVELIGQTNFLITNWREVIFNLPKEADIIAVTEKTSDSILADLVDKRNNKKPVIRSVVNTKYDKEGREILSHKRWELIERVNVITKHL